MLPRGSTQKQTRRWAPVWLASLGLLGAGLGCVAVQGLTINRSGTLNGGPTPSPVVVVVTATPLPAEVTQSGDAEEQVVINVYERVSPSVVHITSRTQVFDFFRGPVPREGTGSGFVYDDQGHIVTNNHVIAGAQQIEVVLADGTQLPAKLIGADPPNDLAVLQADAPPEKMPRVTLGSSESLRVGQRVIAIGNPFGLDRTLTVGVISALNRVIETDQGQPLGQVIQTDAAINPGNSGGPLLNSRGEVIGVNTAIQSPSGGSVGIGFAVPIQAVQRVVPQLIAQGFYPHPDVGFAAYELGLEISPPDNGPQHGLLVVQLESGGPAEQAGIRAAHVERDARGFRVLVGGDYITAVDGKPVKSRNDLILYLEGNKRPGDPITLTLVREGQEQQVQLTLGQRSQ